jgi:glycine/D-amino acid oxidase-like deaminating enzyme
MGQAMTLLASDYSETPLWLTDARHPEPRVQALPSAVDVLVVGSGYTGTTAAYETAQAGRATLVLDSGPIGGGCSSRNGGHVSFSVKPSHEALSVKHGRVIADRLYAEGLEAMTSLSAYVRDEQVSCDWRRVGGFVGAHTPSHYNRLVREAEHQVAGFELPFEVIPKTRQREEIDSPLYHGGVLYPDEMAVHPLKLMVSLYERAVRAGAQFRSHCAVQAIKKGETGFDVLTADGVVNARQVLIATNGYTQSLSPWHQRRVMPIGSYILATEEMDPSVLAQLIPRGRNIGDTRRVITYVRPSHDGRRLIFGGRAAAGESDVTRCVPRLHAMMTEMFPSLHAVRVSRAWMGYVGFTFDKLPHFGQRDGVFYSMGYCGQGVNLATYYGRKIGLRMAGKVGGETALEGMEFPSRPYYHGTPWFLPAAVAAYRLADALGI